MQVRISRPTYVFSSVPVDELIGLQEASNELGITINGLKSLIRSHRLDVVEDMDKLESTRNRSYLFRADFEMLREKKG